MVGITGLVGTSITVIIGVAGMTDGMTEIADVTSRAGIAGITVVAGKTFITYNRHYRHSR